jgi:hypothetical protein
MSSVKDIAEEKIPEISVIIHFENCCPIVSFFRTLKTGTLGLIIEPVVMYACVKLSLPPSVKRKLGIRKYSAKDIIQASEG